MWPPAGNTRSNSARTARRCAATLCQSPKRESNVGATASKAIAAGRKPEVIVLSCSRAGANDRTPMCSETLPQRESTAGQRQSEVACDNGESAPAVPLWRQPESQRAEAAEATRPAAQDVSLEHRRPQALSAAANT